MATRKAITVTYKASQNVGGDVHKVESFDDSEHFPDSECLWVTGMKLFVGKFDGYTVNGGMEVFYNTGKSVLHGNAGYGMKNYEFHLTPGERITSVKANAGGLIDALTFTTDRGNTYGPYGGKQGFEKILDPPDDNGYLAYITGGIDRSGRWPGNAIQRLQFVWASNKVQHN